MLQFLILQLVCVTVSAVQCGQLVVSPSVFTTTETVYCNISLCSVQYRLDDSWIFKDVSQDTPYTLPDKAEEFQFVSNDMECSYTFSYSKPDTCLIRVGDTHVGCSTLFPSVFPWITLLGVLGFMVFIIVIYYIVKIAFVVRSHRFRVEFDRRIHQCKRRVQSTGSCGKNDNENKQQQQQQQQSKVPIFNIDPTYLDPVTSVQRGTLSEVRPCGPWSHGFMVDIELEEDNDPTYDNAVFVGGGGSPGRAGPFTNGPSVVGLVICLLACSAAIRVGVHTAILPNQTDGVRSSQLRMGDVGGLRFVKPQPWLSISERSSLYVLPDECVGNQRIVGGVPADVFGETVVWVLRAYGVPVCTAVYYRQRMYLTASHCVGTNPVAYTLTSPYHEQALPVLAVAHATGDVVYIYDDGSGRNSGDLAVLIVSSDAPDLEYCPSLGEVEIGDNFTVYGYGYTEPASVMSRFAMMVNLTRTNCSEFVSPDSFCSAIEGKDSCNGDSGGLAFSGLDYVGIVSRGPVQCGNGQPGIYQSLTPYRDFIDSFFSGARAYVPPTMGHFVVDPYVGGTLIAIPADGKSYGQRYWSVGACPYSYRFYRPCNSSEVIDTIILENNSPYRLLCYDETLDPNEFTSVLVPSTSCGYKNFVYGHYMVGSYYYGNVQAFWDAVTKLDVTVPDVPTVSKGMAFFYDGATGVSADIGLDIGECTFISPFVFCVLDSKFQARAPACKISVSPRLAFPVFSLGGTYHRCGGIDLTNKVLSTFVRSPASYGKFKVNSTLLLEPIFREFDGFQSRQDLVMYTGMTDIVYKVLKPGVCDTLRNVWTYHGWCPESDYVLYSLEHMTWMRHCGLTYPTMTNLDGKLIYIIRQKRHLERRHPVLIDCTIGSSSKRVGSVHVHKYDSGYYFTTHGAGGKLLVGQAVVQDKSLILGRGFISETRYFVRGNPSWIRYSLLTTYILLGLKVVVLFATFFGWFMYRRLKKKAVEKGHVGAVKAKDPIEYYSKVDQSRIPTVVKDQLDRFHKVHGFTNTPHLGLTLISFFVFLAFCLCQSKIYFPDESANVVYTARVDSKRLIQADSLFETVSAAPCSDSSTAHPGVDPCPVVPPDYFVAPAGGTTIDVVVDSGTCQEGFCNCSLTGLKFDLLTLIPGIVSARRWKCSKGEGVAAVRVVAARPEYSFNYVKTVTGYKFYTDASGYCDFPGADFYAEGGDLFGGNFPSSVQPGSVCSFKVASTDPYTDICCVGNYKTIYNVVGTILVPDPRRVVHIFKAELVRFGVDVCFTANSDIWCFNSETEQAIPGLAFSVSSRGSIPDSFYVLVEETSSSVHYYWGDVVIHDRYGQFGDVAFVGVNSAGKIERVTAPSLFSTSCEATCTSCTLVKYGADYHGAPDKCSGTDNTLRPQPGIDKFSKDSVVPLTGHYRNLVVEDYNFTWITTSDGHRQPSFVGLFQSTATDSVGVALFSRSITVHDAAASFGSAVHDIKLKKCSAYVGALTGSTCMLHASVSSPAVASVYISKLDGYSDTTISFRTNQKDYMFTYVLLHNATSVKFELRDTNENVLWKGESNIVLKTVHGDTQDFSPMHSHAVGRDEYFNRITRHGFQWWIAVLIGVAVLAFLIVTVFIIYKCTRRGYMSYLYSSLPSLPMVAPHVADDFSVYIPGEGPVRRRKKPIEYFTNSISTWVVVIVGLVCTAVVVLFIVEVHTIAHEATHPWELVFRSGVDKVGKSVHCRMGYFGLGGTLTDIYNHSDCHDAYVTSSKVAYTFNGVCSFHERPVQVEREASSIYCYSVVSAATAWLGSFLVLGLGLVCVGFTNSGAGRGRGRGRGRGSYTGSRSRATDLSVWSGAPGYVNYFLSEATKVCGLDAYNAFTNWVSAVIPARAAVAGVKPSKPADYTRWALRRPPTKPELLQSTIINHGDQTYVCAAFLCHLSGGARFEHDASVMTKMGEEHASTVQGLRYGAFSFETVTPSACVNPIPSTSATGGTKPKKGKGKKVPTMIPEDLLKDTYNKLGGDPADSRFALGKFAKAVKGALGSDWATSGILSDMKRYDDAVVKLKSNVTSGKYLTKKVEEEDEDE